MFLIALVSAAPLTYNLSFEERGTHYIRVDVAVTEPTLFELPAWTPGSYRIRDYARNVERVQATTKDGKPLSVQKNGTHQWLVEGAGTLTYFVYARGYNIRSSWLDPEFAVLNGTTYLMRPKDYDGAVSLELDVPDAWTIFAAAPTDGNVLTMDSVDTLYDTPIVLGDFETQSFEVGGKTHRLVHFPKPSPAWTSDKVLGDVRAIVEEQAEFWQEQPYREYLFLNWTGTKRDGLEHRDSTLIQITDDAVVEDAKYLDWLGLLSHEFFHTWNGKRLRPVTLGPFDYSQPNHTPDLWFVEGVTSYYDDLLLVRSGGISPAEWMRRMAKNIRRVEEAPGTGVQSLTEASHDAWVKHYQADENRRNSQTHYYVKGAVVAFALDAKIREVSRGKRSLDDVMRLARDRYGREVGYTRAQLLDVIDEVAQVDMRPLMGLWLEGRESVDVTDALSWFGLSRGEVKPPQPWLGVGLVNSRVTWVDRRGPAAGILQVEDEVLAVDGQRKGVESLKGRSVGTSVEVLVSRRGFVQDVSLVLGEVPSGVSLKVTEERGAVARRRANWWGLR